MAHDNCDGCNEDYDFDKKRDAICIFLKNPECNHVLALCPHCGATTQIFVSPESLVSVLEQELLPVRIHANTPAEILQLASETFGISMAEEDSLEPPHQIDLYAPPREWLMQLYDDLREFGGES